MNRPDARAPVTHRLSSRAMRGACLLLAIAAGAAAASESPAAFRGRHFAQTYCAGCHAIGRFDTSRLVEAPAFRTLAQRYPLSDLSEPLAEGIATGHPSMPTWRLDPGQISDLLDYMRSIQEP